MIPKNGKGWSPYVAGALSGLLIILTVWMTGKYFRASNSFIRTAGMINHRPKSVIYGDGQ